MSVSHTWLEIMREMIVDLLGLVSIAFRVAVTAVEFCDSVMQRPLIADQQVQFRTYYWIDFLFFLKKKKKL